MASQVGYPVTFQQNLRPCFLVRAGRFRNRTYTSEQSECARQFNRELLLDPAEMIHHLAAVLRELVMVLFDVDPEAGPKGQSRLIEHPQHGAGIVRGYGDRLITRDHFMEHRAIGSTGRLEILTHQPPPLLIGVLIVEIDRNMKTIGGRVCPGSTNLSKHGKDIAQEKTLLRTQVDTDPLGGGTEVAHCSTVAQRP